MPPVVGKTWSTDAFYPRNPRPRRPPPRRGLHLRRTGVRRLCRAGALPRQAHRPVPLCRRQSGRRSVGRALAGQQRRPRQKGRAARRRPAARRALGKARPRGSAGTGAARRHRRRLPPRARTAAGRLLCPRLAGVRQLSLGRQRHRLPRRGRRTAVVRGAPRADSRPAGAHARRPAQGHRDERGHRVRAAQLPPSRALRAALLAGAPGRHSRRHRRLVRVRDRRRPGPRRPPRRRAGSQHRPRRRPRARRLSARAAQRSARRHRLRRAGRRRRSGLRRAEPLPGAGVSRRRSHALQVRRRGLGARPTCPNPTMPPCGRRWRIP